MKLNKNVLLLIVALILVVIAAGTFMMFKNSSKVSSVAPTSQTTVSSNQPASSKTLKDLIMSGQAQKCTFKNKDISAGVTGTAYVSNGKMRGDFSSMVAGKTLMMHMVISDKTNYT